MKGAGERKEIALRGLERGWEKGVAWSGCRSCIRSREVFRESRAAPVGGGGCSTPNGVRRGRRSRAVHFASLDSSVSLRLSPQTTHHSTPLSLLSSLSLLSPLSPLTPIPTLSPPEPVSPPSIVLSIDPRTTPHPSFQWAPADPSASHAFAASSLGGGRRTRSLGYRVLAPSCGWGDAWLSS